MDIWISIYYLHMANNIVKWWKTKFLNGYKQFTVECGDGKISDTEELLGKLGSEDDNISNRLRTSCTTPPVQQQSTTNLDSSNNNNNTQLPASNPQENPQSPQQHQLNFEEFSCDVSVENSDKKTGADRQEFSFTLYDFDGHGKITKDDISSLVTTIYEALGSSVKVPHYGSKTIKVKLTVSPDQRKHVSATIINNHQTRDSDACSGTRRSVVDDENRSSSNRKCKRDLNVTISENKRRPSRRHSSKTKISKKHHHHHQQQQQQQQCCHHHNNNNNNNNNNNKRHNNEGNDGDDDNNKRNDDNEELLIVDNNNLISSDNDYSDICSRINDNESDDDNLTQLSDDDCSDGGDDDDQRPKRKNKKYHQRTRYTIPNLFLMKDASISLPTKPLTKKRSGSMQRQELLEIIQANIEKKTNASFQTSRKHYANNQISSECNNSNNIKEQQSSSTTTTNTTKIATNSPLEYLANMVDPTHFYIDLPSLQQQQNTTNNNSIKSHCHNNYDKLIDAVISASSNKKSNTLINKSKKHSNNRIKSDFINSIPFSRYQQLLIQNNNNDNNTNKTMSNNNNNNNNKRTTTPKRVQLCNDTHKINNTKKVNPLLSSSTPQSSPYHHHHSHQTTLSASPPPQSPHHMWRHRNRQEDQARAMAQVVRWLEQEFSTNLHATATKKGLEAKKQAKTKSNTFTQQSKEKCTATGGVPTAINAGIEKHEYHHVHEHIHHHYHHYQDTPLVV